MEKVGNETENNPEVKNLDLAAETERSQEKFDTVVVFSISRGLNIYIHISNI